MIPQATQAHHLSTVLFSIFIDFIWKMHFRSKIKYQNIAINMEIDFTYIDIGLFLSFPCNLGAVRVFSSELFF